MGYRTELEAVRARADALAHTLAQREQELEALIAAARGEADTKVPSAREQRLIAELASARRELAEQKAPAVHPPTDPDAIRKTIFFAVAIAFVVAAAALFAGRGGHPPSRTHGPARIAHAAVDPSAAHAAVDPTEVSCAPTDTP